MVPGAGCQVPGVGGGRGPLGVRSSFLTPVTRQTGVTFTVTASTMVDEIDYAGAYVPARSVQVIVEHQSEVPTSG